MGKNNAGTTRGSNHSGLSQRRGRQDHDHHPARWRIRRRRSSGDGARHRSATVRGGVEQKQSPRRVRSFKHRRHPHRLDRRTDRSPGAIRRRGPSAGRCPGHGRGRPRPGRRQRRLRADPDESARLRCQAVPRPDPAHSLAWRTPPRNSLRGDAQHGFGDRAQHDGLSHGNPAAAAGRRQRAWDVFVATADLRLNRNRRDALRSPAREQGCAGRSRPDECPDRRDHQQT